MKMLGFALLALGFLLGAYATALDIDRTDWSLFVPALAVAVAGLIAMKMSARGEARSEQVLTSNRVELETSLERVLGELEFIIEQRPKTAIDDLRDDLDARLRDDLRRFADARKSMVHLFGIQAYADIMSEFAAGERIVNRVWSASADGYAEEADACLAQALSRFREARRRLDQATGQKAA